LSDQRVRPVGVRIQSTATRWHDHVCLEPFPRTTFPAMFWTDRLSANCQSELPSLTRRIPAASSGLRSPVSAVSYASRRTAANRTLIVEGTRLFCSRKNRYRRTTDRLNANRGSEQYQYTDGLLSRDAQYGGQSRLSRLRERRISGLGAWKVTLLAMQWLGRSLSHGGLGLTLRGRPESVSQASRRARSVERALPQVRIACSLVLGACGKIRVKMQPPLRATSY